MPRSCPDALERERGARSPLGPTDGSQSVSQPAVPGGKGGGDLQLEGEEQLHTRMRR